MHYFQYITRVEFENKKKCRCYFPHRKGVGGRGIENCARVFITFFVQQFLSFTGGKETGLCAKKIVVSVVGSGISYHAGLPKDIVGERVCMRDEVVKNHQNG